MGLVDPAAASQSVSEARGADRRGGGSEVGGGQAPGSDRGWQGGCHQVASSLSPCISTSLAWLIRDDGAAAAPNLQSAVAPRSERQTKYRKRKKKKKNNTGPPYPPNTTHPTPPTPPTNTLPRLRHASPFEPRSGGGNNEFNFSIISIISAVAGSRWGSRDGGMKK